ncbi:MAG: hypothetical protein V3T84_08650 [Phycisphaerales bacterium]
MRRTLLKLVVVLLLGSCTTVFVAWTLAAYVHVRGSNMYVKGRPASASRWWVVRAFRRPGVNYVTSFSYEDGGKSNLRVLDLGEAEWPAAFSVGIERSLHVGQGRVTVLDARGWPRLALWCESIIGLGNAATLIEPEVAGGMIWRKDAPLHNLFVVDRHYRTLPLRPLWSGFFIDTLFYAACWTVVLYIRGIVRRRAQIATWRGAAITACLCLLLGTTSTVGVAWICAVVVNAEYEPHTEKDGWGESLDGVNYRKWTVKREAEVAALRLVSRWSSQRDVIRGDPHRPAEGFVPDWADYLVPTPSFNGTDDSIATPQRVLDARGWPMLAMWGGFEVLGRSVDGRSVYHLGETQYAIVLPFYSKGKFLSNRSRVIPFMPIWIGFIVDTFFWATIWFSLVFLALGPGVIWRTVRHTRGHCIKCGYDLRRDFSAGCPECGWGREEKVEA